MLSEWAAVENCGERKGKGYGDMWAAGSGRSLKGGTRLPEGGVPIGSDSVEKSLEFYFFPLANLTANCGDRREGQALASLLATLSCGSGETRLGIWKSAQWGFIRVPGAGRGGTSSL